MSVLLFKDIFESDWRVKKDTIFIKTTHLRKKLFPLFFKLGAKYTLTRLIGIMLNLGLSPFRSSSSNKLKLSQDTDNDQTLRCVVTYIKQYLGQKGSYVNSY